MVNRKLLELDQFVRIIVSALDAANVEYAIGGSFAVICWGMPRSTQDVDIVVHLKDEQTDKLSAELQEHEIYMPSDIMRDIVADNRSDLPINAIHGYSGYKAELFPLRKGDDLRGAALVRRQLHDYGGEVGEIYLLSPEDLIVYKVKYYSISRQTKHLTDIAYILAHREVDRAYVDQWVASLGLSKVWQEMLSGFRRQE